MLLQLSKWSARAAYGRKTHVFGCSRAVLPKPPEGKSGCSRIISPNLNEGTISNAEVASDSLSPHLLGWSYIFIGFANKNIGKRIMFCCSQAVLFNTSRNGDFRYIDILNIFACIMSPAIKPPFSYTFVSIPLYLHLVATRYSFSFLLFRRNKRKIQPRRWGRSPRKLRRLRWCLR